MTTHSKRAVCEHCWMEWATVRPPTRTGLTLVCGPCFDLLWTTDDIAEAVNGGGRSGTL
jgi:hypothetical protein